MKKNGIIFSVLCVAALIFVLCAIYIFSVSSVMPTFVDGSLDTEQTVGGASSVAITVQKIIYPVAAAACIALAVSLFLKNKNTDTLLIALKDKLARISPIHLFAAVSALITVASLIYIAVFRQHVWDHHVFLFGDDKYMDFFNHIGYVADNPSEVYEKTRHACFPPFAYIFYYLLSLLLPSDAIVNFDAPATSPYALNLYIIYMLVCVFLLSLIIRKLLKNYSEGTSATFTVLLLLSSIFFAVTERANSVLIVLILLLFAMYLRDSDKPVYREIALLFIAFAAGLKLYPAVFGLLYIFEKRFKEAIRLLIYGVVCFFLPFAFFGGIDGLKQFIENQLAVHDGTFVSLTSVGSSVSYISDLIWDDPEVLEGLSGILPPVFAIVCLLAFCDKRLQLWEKTTLLMSVICFFPAWSGSYTAIFFALPMLLFFRQTKEGFGEGKQKYYNLLCTLMFALAFCLVAFVTPNGHLVSDIRYIALHVLNLAVICKSLTHLCSYLKLRRQAAK